MLDTEQQECQEYEEEEFKRNKEEKEKQHKLKVREILFGEESLKGSLIGNVFSFCLFCYVKHKCKLYFI